MAYRDLRDWLTKLEEAGQLKHIGEEVDWDLEVGAIARRAVIEQQPALLFENIKDYHNTACHKLFMNNLGSRERTAVALGLPSKSDYRRIVEFVKDAVSRRLDSVKVASGPVKENIVKDDAVNLYEFPVPKYHHMDGGRYINSHGMIVTMDPDTKLHNVGVYRGMIGDDNTSIPSLLVRSQHWGLHFSEYEKRGEEMPVAVIYGYDPILLMCAGAPLTHPRCSEYEVTGGIRGEPVELVKCETSDLYVPASAEIVVEGWISPDPKTFQMEGPFGEYTGFYGGGHELAPVIRVECVTYRDAPIFEGHLAGHSPGRLGPDAYWEVAWDCAAIWNYLEVIGVPGITGVWSPRVTCATNLRISIDKHYRGHAKQVAAAIWSSKLSTHIGKNVTVVDSDIDIFDDQAMEWALAHRVNADMGAIQFFSGTIGSSLDPSVPLPQRDIGKYGAGKWTRVLIDATVNWDIEPEEQYGGRREPPLCTRSDPGTEELINQRWQEYGF